MKVIYTIARTSLALSVIVFLTVTAFAQDKLLLSEIVVGPDGGEYIEIFNLGGSPVTLTDYYLTDATSSGINQFFYYNIVKNTGIYFYRMTTGDFSKTQKMMFLK